MSIYTNIRQFLQPYYKPRSKGAKKKKLAQEIAEDTAQNVPQGTNAAEARKYAVRIFNYPRPLEGVWQAQKQPSSSSIWAYHDSERHEVYARFEPGDGFRFRERSNIDRRQLKPLIYPKQDVPFDRTHLIPFGYHGSERDPRLLVGWDSKQNQTTLERFEAKAKRLKYPIYWYASITRTSSGATFRYKIFSVETKNLVAQLEQSMQCPFAWFNG